MLATNDMDLDPDTPNSHSNYINETYNNNNLDINVNLIETAVAVVTTPVRVIKKRKIEQKEEIDESNNFKSIIDLSLNTNSNNANANTPTTAPNTPSAPVSNNNVNGIIKMEMKRLLQSKDSELSKYYQIKSNNKLIMIQGQVGEAPYRHHPSTIRELNDYFNDIKNKEIEPDFVYINYMKENYSGLIAKLTQDSQVTQSELLASLRSILFPIASGIYEFPIDSSLFDGIIDKYSYGHPEAGNNFSNWSCTFWQVKKLDTLGESIGLHLLENLIIRNKAKKMLENAFKTETNDVNDIKDDNDHVNISNNYIPISAPILINCVNLFDDLPMNLMKIESGTETPKKQREKEKEKNGPIKEKSTTISTAAAATLTTSTSLSMPTAKISSFFAKLKKPEGIERITGEYFHPFFVKPDVTMAPYDQLKNLKIQASNLSSDEFFESSEEYWKWFCGQRVKIDYKRKTCLCVGFDGRPTRAILKLFKFEENYRPAYLGTWRKSITKGTLGPRCPFFKISDVDYEYDSDGEWDEGDDPEGESLSDLDDDDEDDDDDDELDCVSQQSCNQSVDSWLVPHGYLSDDEGVDEGVHPGELEEAAASAELQPPPPLTKRKERRKFVPKDPLVLGPFFLSSDQSQVQIIPQILQASTIQFINNNNSMWQHHLNPFSNYETVFSGLEILSSSSSKKNFNGEFVSSSLASSDKGIFPEALLPSLIQIINSNLSAGITKLYDEFILQHGKTVSRRLFESKLNQITTGKIKCEKSGKLRWNFKEDEVIKRVENENENENLRFNHQQKNIFMQM